MTVWHETTGQLVVHPASAEKKRQQHAISLSQQHAMHQTAAHADAQMNKGRVRMWNNGSTMPNMWDGRIKAKA